MNFINQLTTNQQIVIGITTFLMTINIFSNIFSSRPYLSALFHLPGTILHELAHFLVGLFLFARPVGFSLIPKREGNNLTLGSVSFVNIRFFNAIPVAFAPLLLFLLAFFLLQNTTLIYNFFTTTYNINEYMFLTIFGYIIYSSISSALPSSQDLSVALSSYLGILFYMFIVFFAINPLLIEDFLTKILANRQ